MDTAFSYDYSRLVLGKQIIQATDSKPQQLSQQTLLTLAAVKKVSFRNKNSWLDCRAVARAEAKLLSSFADGCVRCIKIS